MSPAPNGDAGVLENLPATLDTLTGVPSVYGASTANGRRSTPPTAIKLLLPVWGDRFVRQFLEAGLPTLLAPGNLPAIAAELPCEFLILTSGEDEPAIGRHLAFRALSEMCAAEIRVIDHLITGTNYSTTLTLAYTEAVRAAGPAMIDTCFLFLLSDYIVADGSLAHVVRRMVNGASGVLTGNFQVAVEDAFPWLQAQLSRAAPVLALPSRELMRWGLSNLHPAVVANTVNFPLNHNRHTNRLFWRVDGPTLIGRFYLMHPIAVRPETADFVIGASCDYSFIPEMCPSGNVEVITDSDEFLVVEMQPRDHEAAFLRPGPLRPRALAKTLSEWTTRNHRENVHHSVVFHAEDLPATLPAAMAAADRFVADAERWMRRKPQPHRDHPYWRGALASQREATGERLDMVEQWLALGFPDALLTRFEHPFARRLVNAMIFVLFGRPPFVRPWHPRWNDYTLVLKQLQSFVQDSRQRLLMVADRPTEFTVSLSDDGERTFRLRRTQFLERPQESYRPLFGCFDLCLAELSEDELAQSNELLDRIAPLMKPEGRILVVVYNRRRRDAAGFAASIGYHATRFMRSGTSLAEIRVVTASRSRWHVAQSITDLAFTVYHRPLIGVPLLALSGGFLAACSLVANAVAHGKSMRTLRPGTLATSFQMVLRVEASGRDAFQYGAVRLMRECLRKRLGIDEASARASVLTRHPHTAQIVHGARPSDRGRVPAVSGDGREVVCSASATAATADLPTGEDETREPQYERCVEIRDRIGLTPLGIMTNQVWYDDPRRLGILLSRYKFVAKMLNGRSDVGEVGCGDAFGSRVVLQEVAKLTVYDFDPVFIADIRQRFCKHWPLEAEVHDIVAGPLPRRHDGLYSLDVIEHIATVDEHAYLKNLRASLTDDGVLIIGSPSRESQPYASPQSRAGHVNCKSGAEMKAFLERYFVNVFLFSMNDEVVHTGFYPMAHYLLAVCCGKK